MPAEIYLIKVGMTMTEGNLEEWYVADGAIVQPGDLLYRLETEKVEVDVDAETEGTVKHLIAEGTTLEPGHVVGFIFAPGEEIPEVLPTPTHRPETEPPTLAKPTSLAPKASPAANEPGRTTAAETERRPSSPAARKLASELGIDLGNVEGTGPRGRITKEDVERAAASPDNISSGVEIAGSARIRGVRKTIAQRMRASLADTAQLTMDMEVDMDKAVQLRARLVDEWASEDIRVSYTDLIVFAAAKALLEHPRMNSAFVDNAIVSHNSVNIGVAVALEEGLVVPVIHDLSSKDLQTVARLSAELAQKARSGSLELEDVQGGTFTVTSLGMYGVDSFTPILNAPQTGILGVGRIYDALAWDGDTPKKCQRMRLSLTWDHQVLDGAPAAEFLANIRVILESPDRLLV